MPTILISVHAVNRYLKRIDRNATHIEARRILVAAARNATMTPRKTFDGASIWETPVVPIRLITKSRWCEPGFVKCVTVLTLDEEYELEEETIAEVLDAATRATGAGGGSAEPAVEGASSAPVAPPAAVVVAKKKPDPPHVVELKTHALREKLKLEQTRRLELEAKLRVAEGSQNKNYDRLLAQFKTVDAARAKAKRDAIAHNVYVDAQLRRAKRALRAAVRCLLGVDDAETALARIRAIDPTLATMSFATPEGFEKHERARLHEEALRLYGHGETTQ